MVEPERIEGDLPNGGAYALLYYQDKDGSPVEKGQALRVEVFEYDASDKAISITVLDLEGGDGNDTTD